jgi:transcriptional regulator with XRE-family HTH domain
MKQNQATIIPLEFGKRIKQIRQFLGLTQHQVAESLHVQTPAITNMEGGKGGSSGTLYYLLKFYAQYVYIDTLFDENFEIIKRSGNVASTKSRIRTSVVLIKLKAVQSDLEKAISYLE